MSVPTPAGVFAAFFAAAPEPGADLVTFGPCDRMEAEPGPDEPVPFMLTGQAEAALDVGQPEPAEEEAQLAAAYEAEWADEWDCVDSSAYMDRVEAGLEPEAEP
jgi:hypothetical protein